MNYLNKIKINSRSIELLRNFFYVIFSNLTSVLISILVVLIIPKFIGVDSYGYWQLYMLYTSFVGLMHLGWNDGIYLRYGGKSYKDLDKKLFSSQFYLLFVTQLTLAICGLVIFQYLNLDYEKLSILKMTMLCMIIVNTRYFILFLLQATYRIKEYSLITIFDRVIYLILILGLLFYKFEDYKLLIWVDIIGKTVSLLLGIWYCKDIFINSTKSLDLTTSLIEMLENIKVGIKLMLSNFSNKLIVGNVRLGIESVWSVAIFGKISLMLSITSFFMIFIGSIGLVLFPLLRRINQADLTSLYIPIREILNLILLILLFAYYPLLSFIKFWLPEYSDTAKYLLIILPTLIFEGKISLLINTYLKVLRKEKFLLSINFIIVIISICFTIISVYYFKNINAAIFSILIISFLKALLSELYIQNLLNIRLWPSIILEVLIILAFICINILYNPLTTVAVYFFILSLYFFIRRDNLMKALTYFKNRI